MRKDLPNMNKRPLQELSITDEIISQELKTITNKGFNTDCLTLDRIFIANQCLAINVGESLSNDVVQVMLRCDLVKSSPSAGYELTPRGAMFVFETYGHGVFFRNESISKFLFNNYEKHAVDALTTSSNEVVSRFDGLNFGLSSYGSPLFSTHSYLLQGCLKRLADYWNGHTMYQIMTALELVYDTKKDGSTESFLSKKGELLLYRSFVCEMDEYPADFIQYLAKSISGRKELLKNHAE